MSHMEKEMLRYIINFKMVNGFAPTRSEIKKGMNTKSDQWVDEILNRLEEQGAITKCDNKARKHSFNRKNFSK